MIRMNGKLSTYFEFLVNKSLTALRLQRSTYPEIFARLWRENNCYLCDQLHSSGLLICPDCIADLPWNSHVCDRCQLPLPQIQPVVDGLHSRRNGTSSSLCGSCIKQLPTFDHCIAPLIYQHPLKGMMRHFKFHQQRYLGNALAELLARQIIERYPLHILQSLCMVAVPLHRHKLKQRGFNTAQDITETLLTRFHKAGVTVATDHQLLQKIKETHSQVGLDKKQRMLNLRNSFEVSGDPARQHIALVDDVMTTGATTEYLATLLKQAGAKQVDVWCLARTPRVK